MEVCLANLKIIHAASTKLLGFPSNFPLFICPFAFARLGHSSGEIALVKAAAKTGVIYIVSLNLQHSRLLQFTLKLGK